MDTVFIILVVFVAATTTIATGDETTTATGDETTILMGPGHSTTEGNIETTSAATADAVITSRQPVITTALVCSCNLAKLRNVSANSEKCSEYKKVLGCLTSSPTCNTVAVNISTEAAVIVKSANCKLTETCMCERTYSTSSRDSKENQCSAAKTLKTCLEAIISTKDVSCDSLKTTDKLIKESAEPEIKSKCNGATTLYVISHIFVLCLTVIGWWLQQ